MPSFNEVNDFHFRLAPAKDTEYNKDCGMLQLLHLLHKISFIYRQFCVYLFHFHLWLQLQAIANTTHYTEISKP